MKEDSVKRIGSILALALALPACTDIAYYDGIETLRIDDSTPESEHPSFTYWVQLAHDLDYAPPVTQADFDSLGDPQAEPAGRNPWIKAGDVDLAVEWALTNDTDEDMTAWVMLDGATEFYEWDPVPLYGLAGGEDAEELPFPTLLGFTPLELGGGETVRGEFREDDLREAAFDLDVLTRFCGGPFAVLYNRHEVDPIGTEYVPEDAVIAGFYRIRLTLGADGPTHLQYGIRVRDRERVLYDANAAEYDERFAPEPEPESFMPSGFAIGVEGTMSEYCVDVSPPESMP